jgi:hypothetical protein
MKNIYRIIIFLTFGLLLFGCSKKEDKIVAQVNGEKLYETEFRSLFTREEWQNTSQEEKNKIKKDWIEITLLSREAKKLGLQNEKDVKFNIEYSRKTILANKILANKLKKIDVTEDEIFTYYNLNRKLFMREVTSYKIQKFIVTNWAIADSSIKLFNEGEAFYTVAKNLGSDYVVKVVEKKDVSAALWNLLSGMKKWNIRIIKDKGKLNIVQLLDIRKKPVPIAFNTIKDSMKSQLIENKRKSFLSNALDSLKIKYKAKVF